jgi:hypothetical protein
LKKYREKTQKPDENRARF